MRKRDDRVWSSAPKRKPWLKIRDPIPRGLYWMLAVAGLLTPLLIWWVGSAFAIVEPRFLPAPLTVLDRGYHWLVDEGLAADTLVSVERVFGGFLLAAIIGMPIGILIGTFRVFEAYFEPVNDFFRYMPTPAFIPLVMIWIGIGEGAKISIIFLGTFFQLVLMVADNVRQVPLQQIEAARNNGRQPPRSDPLCHTCLRRCRASPTHSASRSAGHGHTWSSPNWWPQAAVSGFRSCAHSAFCKPIRSSWASWSLVFSVLALDQIARLMHRRLFPWTRGR